jgi:hypothetical protein
MLRSTLEQKYSPNNCSEHNQDNHTAIPAGKIKHDMKQAQNAPPKIYFDKTKLF